MLLHASNASAPTQQLDSKLEDKPEQQAADTENDTLFRTIVAKLGAAGTTHSLLHHRPTRTSEEVREAISSISAVQTHVCAAVCTSPWRHT